MKLLVPLTFASILLVSACATTPKDASVHKHLCESGETIISSYPSTESASVQYKGTDYTMQIAVSGSGARYVGGGMEWWTKGSGTGSDGTLFRHNADGTTGQAVESCKGI